MRFGRALRIAAAVLATPVVITGANPVAAAVCTTMAGAGGQYAVCEVAASEDLRLFLRGADGVPYGSFDRLRRALAAAGEQLLFATNAGMYHPDRSPVGLHIEAGRQIARLVTRAGPGNFGLLPNGVFCIGPGRLAVVESREFARHPPACRYATQSGPMLVIDGRLHPRFLPDSASRYIRNGVGVNADGSRAWFAISDRPVTFHEFASFFRDRLNVQSALYLDGSVSKLYAPDLGRNDNGRPMGPILGVVAPVG